MSFEYYLVVSYEIILYQHCKFSTNYRSAVIDKYGKEAAVGGAIQLYKIVKGYPITHHSYTRPDSSFALCLYTAIIYIGC